MKKYWTRTRQQLLEHVGSIDQLASARRVKLLEGRAKGIEAFEVNTGSGLCFTTLIDRALDIAGASWCGQSLCWSSSAGVSAPAYYERAGVGWLRGFGGGLLTTCGLRNVGPPVEENGEAFGQHGEISYIPAENAALRTHWDDNRYCIEISGEVREAYPFGPNLHLHRTWRTELGANWIELHDLVTNHGFREELHMHLYHFNFGFPLVNAAARVYTSTNSVEGHRESDKPHLGEWSGFQAPTKSFAEQVFYHSYSGEPPDRTSVLVADSERDPSLAVLLSFRSLELPHLAQWKMCGQGEYVLGIEPANCLITGRVAHRRKSPTLLAPGQSVTFDLRLTVLDDRASIESTAKSLHSS